MLVPKEAGAEAVLVADVGGGVVQGPELAPDPPRTDPQVASRQQLLPLSERSPPLKRCASHSTTGTSRAVMALTTLPPRPTLYARWTPSYVDLLPHNPPKPPLRQDLESNHANRGKYRALQSIIVL